MDVVSGLCSAYRIINGVSSRSFAVYLVAASSLAVAAAAFFLPSYTSAFSRRNITLSSPTVHAWPDLEVSWRSALATVIGFLGSAFGTVGGVGGGGIFVPMLNLIVGFDTKSAAALSKCMIMGASASSVWYNLRVAHPSKEVPIIDYNLALLFQPMLMLGITIGVDLSVIFPYWLITVLIIILFIGTSSRSMFRGVQMWKQETLLKMEMEKQVAAQQSNQKQVDVDTKYEPLLPQPEKTTLEVLMFNIRWKGITVLMLVWFTFLLLQILKSKSESCSLFHWVVTVGQFPVALIVFGKKAAELWRESRLRRMRGNWECVCEASIEWTPVQLLFCAFCGLLGGTVGGLLGSGGGFILGPLLLEIGVIPQVASATATFVMMFSSSLSVLEFYFLKRFPIPYALYLIAVSVLAGFWGQSFVRKIVKILKRASIIVFILSAVIFASALTMGVVGTQKSISMIKHHEYMGFLSFCQK
ncbi:sulfite exporter TauE/SafE family protein 4-like [Zingiber officinale]|uniref:sulfite exporter TauE/SafE family protein 4-like n=1 Tax=Zingiber officinale TaxID=94328 RepID=UPI001C4C3F79|nr:sulfite exporter TauE/SafE family protein 4-like [Zingiber officinale]